MCISIQFKISFVCPLGRPLHNSSFPSYRLSLQNRKISAYTLPHCKQRSAAQHITSWRKRKKKTNGKKSFIENSFSQSIWVEHQRARCTYTIFEKITNFSLQLALSLSLRFSFFLFLLNFIWQQMCHPITRISYAYLSQTIYIIFFFFFYYCQSLTCSGSRSSAANDATRWWPKAKQNKLQKIKKKNKISFTFVRHGAFAIHNAIMREETLRRILIFDSPSLSLCLSLSFCLSLSGLGGRSTACRCDNGGRKSGSGLEVSGLWHS